jgi:hypothetical protein
MVLGTANRAQAVTTTQTSTYTVSVTVDNAFTMTETTAMSFGTITALNAVTAADVATLTMNGETGATSTSQAGGNNALIIEVTAGAPGVITITGAPPSTAMTITDPAAVDVTNPGAPTTTAKFSADLTAVGSGFSNTTSAAGVLVIKIGGALSTVVDASLTYADATYTGTYSVQVAF